MDDQELSKTFCILPWTHFSTKPDGTVQLCCVARNVLKADGSFYNIRRDGLDAIWNSPAYKHIRQALLNGEEIEHCGSCYRNEKNGMSSRRQDLNNIFLKEYAKPGMDKFFNRLVDPSDPLTVKTPVYFDLRLGNLCNLKCRMCWSGASSQIERDPVAAAWWPGDPQQPIGEDAYAWPNAASLMENLKAFCIDTIKLDLVGGEPSVNKSQLDLLQFFVDKGMASQIQLYGASNYTNVRDRAFELFAKFKNPHMNMSIEGFGNVYEYIRAPGKWDTIAKNVLTVREKYPHIAFDAAITYQAYNILSICELFDWCWENKIPFTTQNLLYEPFQLRISVLPQEARELAAQRIEHWVAKHLLSEYDKHNLGGIIHYLRDQNQQPTAEDVDNFVRYTNDLDRSRKQDIRESLPELYEIWCRHRPWDHEAFKHYKPPAEAAAA